MFCGLYLLGDGFILSANEARQLLAQAGFSHEVILPYINGKELYSLSDYSPQRYAINFWDWPIEQAEHHHALFCRVRDLVKPVRDKVDRERNRTLWWLHAENRPGLYHAIGLGARFARHPKGWTEEGSYPTRVIVKAKTSNTWAFTFLQSHFVFDQAITVIAQCSTGLFAALQSSIHEIWARNAGTGSTMKSDLRYSPSTFETFPFLGGLSLLESIGERYYSHRENMIRSLAEGLTQVYNRLHTPDEHADDIQRLRELHAEMDRAVAGAYGWTDLDLGHDFHETKQGIRFTISESARREILDRLLALNHQRYTEEVAQGLHDKGSKSKAPRKNAKTEQGDLF